jgi:poly(3-hydroxybutyrate) depolymerase/methionine-rich copper-binding protein CopC
MKIKTFMLLVLTVSATAHSYCQQTRQTIRTITSGTIRYWEYLPSNYSPAGQKIPVVFFLHGMEERGDLVTDMNNILTANASPPRYVEQGKDFPFVLISPQLKTNYGAWPVGYIDQVIEHVKANYNIDTDQIYLTGLSLGGGGVWGYAQDPVLGQKLRGIAPVCGHQNNPAKACNIVNSGIRVWAFHGQLDNTVSVSKTINMVNAINACQPAPNPLAIKTIYPNVKHNAWDNAYRVDTVVHNPNLYQWMMQTFNGSPVANAGADQVLTLPQNTVTLTGSGTTPNGTISSYFWQQVSGGSCVLSGENTNTLQVSGLSAGTYIFSLQVTSSDGHVSAPDQVTVTVSSANNPPVANAGPDVNITLPQSGVTLNGSGTDSDGAIISYAWTKQSGGSYTIAGEGTQNPALGGLTAGTYIFRLTVTDDDGAVAFDDISVVVHAQSSSSSIIWNSYDIVMQSQQTQQGKLSSTDNSINATVEFYQSTENTKVTRGTLFPVFNPGDHPNSNSATTSYWANVTGNAFPYAGKSKVPRGNQHNDPSPTGVFDLEMHPPNSDKLTVAAFIVPAAGNYSISNVAVRRIYYTTSGTSTLRVFDNHAVEIFSITGNNSLNWISNTTTYDLGSLNTGERIYFGIDRDANYASDFTEIAWTITMTPPNTPPAANAGSDITIALPQTTVSLTGSATDTDGVIASYFWTQLSGNVATISDANMQSPLIGNLAEGTYTFKLTVTDDDGATAFDEVTVTVTSPPQVIWNSYDIVMQSQQTQQGKLNSTDNSIEASIEFYQSTENGKVTRGTLLPVFNPGDHPNGNGFATSYWANAIGNSFPYAGKTKVPRGNQHNDPAPAGAYDLQMHPPNSDKLIVTAFIAPATGNYSISNVAVRRLYYTTTGTSTLRVFDNHAVEIFSLTANNSLNWMQNTATYDLGNLSSGERIYFGIDRDANYASDFTALTWTITMTSTTGGRLKTFSDLKPQPEDENVIGTYPNPVKNTLYFDGLASEAEVRIYNAMGTLVQESKVDQQTKSIELEPGRFQYGFYIMKLETNGAIHYHKFLKE